MLTVQNVSFAYDTTPILKNVSFTIEKGQHIALIGASGCGKSTLLKIIYGILDVDQGTVFWDDQRVLGPAYNLVPGQENMKYLSQGFELQSYRTVSENIGQYLSNFEPELKIGRVNELLEIVEMTPFATTKIEDLSGGQKQRVALAKALAKKPELLLLDEPFGNIDNFRRSSLRRNLLAYLTRNNITSITATHDKTDILSFAQETIVIHKGKLIAKEDTYNLYTNPKNYYIASLFSEVNQVLIKDFLPDFQNNQTILLYPHEVQIVENSNLKAKVKKSYFNGNYFLIEAIFNDQVIFIEHPTSFTEADQIAIQVSEETLTSRSST